LFQVRQELTNPAAGGASGCWVEEIKKKFFVIHQQLDG
jgi:hypothetical protein